MTSQRPSLLVLDLRHSWEGCSWLHHWDSDILEGILLLNGHISTFALPPFGMCLCGGVSGRMGSVEGQELTSTAQENTSIDCLISTIYPEVKITVKQKILLLCI